MELVAKNVARFMQDMGQIVRSYPTTDVTEKEKKLRINLIHEEINKELIPALKAGDLVGIADGAMDAVYVIIGALLTYGIDPYPLWVAVQEANMAKLTGPIRPEDGKRLKPEGWQPPPIAELLEGQKQAGQLLQLVYQLRKPPQPVDGEPKWLTKDEIDTIEAFAELFCGMPKGMAQSRLLVVTMRDFVTELKAKQLRLEKLGQVTKDGDLVPEESYFIGYDNSSHTYIVPLSRADDWRHWNSIPEDEPAAWDVPEYATKIEGERLIFSSYSLDSGS